MRSFPRQVEAARLQPASPDPSGFRIAAASSVVTLSGKHGIILRQKVQRAGEGHARTRSVRTAKLDLRLSPEAKHKLQAAASASQRSVSEFVLERRLAARRRRWRTGPGSAWTPSDGRHSWRPLTLPPRDLPRLARLFQEPGVFEGGAVQ